MYSSAQILTGFSEAGGLKQNSRHQSLLDNGRAPSSSYTQSFPIVMDFSLFTTSPYIPAIDTRAPIATNTTTSPYFARSPQYKISTSAPAAYSPSHQPSDISIPIDFSQYTSSFTVLEDHSTFALSSNSEIYEIHLKTTKKYKPVALKIKPVESTLPSQFRIIRNVIGDPLAKLPILNPNPPPFTPTGRYTLERKELFDKNNSDFLLPAERDLLHHFMTVLYTAPQIPAGMPGILRNPQE